MVNKCAVVDPTAQMQKAAAATADVKVAVGVAGKLNSAQSLHGGLKLKFVVKGEAVMETINTMK